MLLLPWAVVVVTAVAAMSCCCIYSRSGRLKNCGQNQTERERSTTASHTCGSALPPPPPAQTAGHTHSRVLPPSCQPVSWPVVDVAETKECQEIIEGEAKCRLRRMPPENTIPGSIPPMARYRRVIGPEGPMTPAGKHELSLDTFGNIPLRRFFLLSC